MKTVKALVKELCKREGLKKQVDIAQMNEIVGHLSDIVTQSPMWKIESLLFRNGVRRAFAHLKAEARKSAKKKTKR
jgi:hypothetical protein